MTKEVKQTKSQFVGLLEDIRLANEGNTDALSRLKTGIKKAEANDLVQFVGNLAHQAELSLLSEIKHNGLGSLAVIQEKLSRIRNDLGWETSTAMERLLIENVGLAWLDHHLALMRCNQLLGNANIATIDHLQKKVDRTQNRYLKAIKTLATVRKMALPMLIQVQANLSLGKRNDVIQGEIAS